MYLPYHTVLHVFNCKHAGTFPRTLFIRSLSQACSRFTKVGPSRGNSTWQHNNGYDATWFSWCKNSWDVDEHPWKLIWRWKISFFNRKYIFKWWIFHCHISFWGGNIFVAQTQAFFLVDWLFSDWYECQENDEQTYRVSDRNPCLRPYGPIEIQQKTSSLKTEIVKLPVFTGSKQCKYMI